MKSRDIIIFLIGVVIAFLFIGIYRYIFVQNINGGIKNGNKLNVLSGNSEGKGKQILKNSLSGIQKECTNKCICFQDSPGYSGKNYVNFLKEEFICCSGKIYKYIEKQINKRGLVTGLYYGFYALGDDTKFLTLLYLCEKYKIDKKEVINYLKNIFNITDAEVRYIKDKDVKKFIYYRLMGKVYDPEWRKEILNMGLSIENVDVTRKDFDPIPLSNVLIWWYLNGKLSKEEINKYFKRELYLILNKRVSYIDPFDVFNIRFYDIILNGKTISGDCLNFLISGYKNYLNSILSDEFIPNRCSIDKNK